MDEDEKDLVKHMIDALESGSGRELSNWEEGFLSSVSDQFQRRGELSERQVETLKKIYKEKGE